MRRSAWRWAAALLGLCGLLVGAVAIGLLAWARHDSVASIGLQMTRLAPWLRLWRLGLFAITVVYWRELVLWISRAFALDPDNTAELIRWRWRAAAWLLIMDLVLVEGLVGRIQGLLA